MFCKAKSAKNNFFLRGDFRPLPNKNVQRWDHFFPLLSPKDSENLKSLDIGLQEMGTKKRLNGVNKWEKKTKFFFHRGDFRPFLSKTVQISKKV